MKEQAKTLHDVYLTLSPKPLLGADEFDAFYRDEPNQVRGRDLVAWLKLRLERARGAESYKALLMGHSGVGKSTELTRLVRELHGKFRAIRFSATEHLDPVSFQPFDVLLLMIIEVAQQTAKPIEQGGANARPPDEVLRKVLDWFAAGKETVKTTSDIGVKAEAGVGPSAESLWAKALGLFGSIRGEMKFATARENETVAYKLSRLDELIRVANTMFRECNGLLRKATGADWLFLAEDFDKAGIPSETTERLFVTYSNVIRELDAHTIFTLPIGLGYSERAPALPVASDNILCLPDTMVFDPDHKPHTQGRAAVRAVLEARVHPDLFAERQMERLMVASGGNLRDLFALVSHAADSALLRDAAKIAAADTDGAILNLKSDYERRLGQSPYDTQDRGKEKPAITYEQKAERLLRIYNQEPTARIPDPVLYSLLHARAVQEFNGERWFGVHPLVVDILASQGKLKRQDDGHVPGGTE